MVDSLRERIAGARKSVEVAERRLGGIIGGTVEGARAQKVEASQELRAALTKLRAARAKLAHLEGRVTDASLHVARQTVLETIGELDRAIRDLRPELRSNKVWVTPALEAAIAAATTARERLAELEGALTSDR